MTETIKDLEAIREALYINKWGFAGHSTGGMLALVYATEAQESLTKIIVGMQRRARNMHLIKIVYTVVKCKI